MTDPRLIDDDVTRNLDRYAVYVLNRYAYNAERANWERAQRWAALYGALLIAAQDVIFEPDREDA
jgi:hypothetical protein